MRVSLQRLNAFVVSQQDWVLSTVDKLIKQKKEIKRLAPDAYVDGALIPFKGKDLPLKIKVVKSANVQVKLDGDVFTAFGAKNLLTESDVYVKQALIVWLKNKALEDARKMVLLHAKTFDLIPKSIRIKTQKSRWGSCGIHNDINLNWLLILAPEKVMEYVVVHEICHIKERNHSARFWRLVESHLPGYQQQRNWLKLHGRYLMQGL